MRCLVLLIAFALLGCSAPQPIRSGRVDVEDLLPRHSRAPEPVLPLVAAASGPPVRPFLLESADYNIAAAERSRLASMRKEAIVRELFERAHVALPPARFL